MASNIYLRMTVGSVNDTRLPKVTISRNRLQIHSFSGCTFSLNCHLIVVSLPVGAYAKTRRLRTGAVKSVVANGFMEPGPRGQSARASYCARAARRQPSAHRTAGAALNLESSYLHNELSCYAAGVFLFVVVFFFS